MYDRLILASQKVTILDEILNYDLIATDFDWITRESRLSPEVKVSVLLHKKTKYFFQFDFKRNDHYCYFSPGSSQLFKSAHPQSWPLQLEYFNDWMLYLKREINAPDVWAMLNSEKSIIESVDSIPGNNALFNEVEKGKIKDSILELKEYIVTNAQINESQINILDQKLNYLLDASDRMGRKDWVNISISVLLGIIVQLGLPQITASDTFNFFGTIFKWLIKGTDLLH